MTLANLPAVSIEMGGTIHGSISVRTSTDAPPGVIVQRPTHASIELAYREREEQAWRVWYRTLYEQTPDYPDWDDDQTGASWTRIGEALFRVWMEDNWVYANQLPVPAVVEATTYEAERYSTHRFREMSVREFEWDSNTTDNPHRNALFWLRARERFVALITVGVL